MSWIGLNCLTESCSNVFNQGKTLNDLLQRVWGGGLWAVPYVLI